MDSEATTLGLHVYTPHGFGVTVEVIDPARGGEVVAQHAAGTWLELDYWAAKYGVPQERIELDEEALEVLGAR